MAINITFRSPNYSPRGGRPISLLVLHATAGSARSALAWLTNSRARVSAHYVIDKQGQIYQLVPDEHAAWHAGRASWRNETDINAISIGIELENANTGHDPYPPEQIDALVQLASEKVAQYRIEPDMVVRHRDIAVPRGRKTDPAGFPWAEFRSRLFPQSPPPPERPPRPAPLPDPRTALAQALRAEAYRQVGAIDRPDWAMSRVARDEALGLPISASFDITVGGNSYIAQPFGKDTLISPIGDWQRVDRLGGLLAPEQQPLREVLLRAVYEQAGETYHPDWAFHQYALRTPLGPPLGPSFRFTIDGQAFVAACYALDTIYSPVDRWKEIGRLSVLTRGAASAPRQALIDALLDQLYRRVGNQFRAEWPFHNYALREQLGAPLGRSFRLSIEGHDYTAEAFALDVVYAEIGNGKELGRLSTLRE